MYVVCDTLVSLGGTPDRKPNELIFGHYTCRPTRVQPPRFR